jgi:hypothetical protein
MASGHSIRIEPNPKRRLGGYARLVFPGVQLEPGGTLVIQRESDGHYLGAAGWQPGSVAVQPDEILREGGDGVMEIGPAVVDHIDTYSLLRIEVPAAGIRSRATWPDDIAPSPGQAKAGAIQGSWRSPSAGAAAVPEEALAPAASEEPAEPEAAVPPRGTAGQDEEQKEGKATGRWGRFALLAVILAGGIVAAYFLLWHDGVTLQEDPEPVITEEKNGETSQETPAPVAGPGCTRDKLREAARLQDAEAPAALMALSEVCGGEDNNELRFAAIDQAATRGHGPAVMQMGRWYDPEYADADQSPLPPQAANAVRYYRQAADLEVPGAREALDNVCVRLKDSSDPVEQAAAESYCMP